MLLITVLLTIAGCSRDPQVRKQKYFQSGQRYFEQGKYPEAIIQFSNAIQVDPRFGDAQYQLARSYLKMEHWRQAYDTLTRTLELRPDNYQARLDLANLLIAAHDPKQAQEHTNILLEKQPGNAPVHDTAAHVLAALGDPQGAIQETQKAINLAPGRWESYFALAMLQTNANQPELAELNFKKALELNPKATDARLAFADFCRSRGRLPEAEQQIRTAVDNDPNSTDSRAALVRLYVIEGKKTAAEDFLKQAKRDLPENPVAYRMLGDYYFAAGDIENAAAEYQSLYHDHPKDLRVKINYVQLLILRGRLEEAGKLNDEILKQSPAEDEALICRGQIQNREGHPGDAVDTLQRLLRNSPDNAIAHYHLGVAYDSLGNWQLAESEWQDAARLRPDLVEAHRALAQMALRKADMSALAQSATEIIKLEPLSPDGYVLRAASHIGHQQYDRAEQDVREAIELAPQQAAGYVQMGNLRFVQQNFSEAERAYREALAKQPNSPDALSGLMNACLEQKQPDKAVAAAQAQIAKVPDNSAFQDLLATVLFDTRHDLPGARAALEKSLQLDRNNSDALIKLGRVQVAQGSVDEAIATYQSWIKDHPRQPELYTLAGELYESKHDWEDAKQMYQRALEISPNNPLACNNLAYVLLKTGGNVDIALSLAQIARQGMPNSPNAADTLGWVYYQKGAYKSAIDLFQEALRLIDKSKVRPDPNIHYHLGLAYERTNQPALARQHLQTVLKINPNYSDAAEVKKQLAELRLFSCRRCSCERPRSIPSLLPHLKLSESNRLQRPYASQ
jgi:tetratricopeptide (TPR) repeat protein